MNLKKNIAAGILITILSAIVMVFSVDMYNAIGIAGLFIIPGLILLVCVLSWCLHTLIYDDE